MADKTIRNLANLEHSASSARVLNLRRVARLHGEDAEYRLHPLFRHAVLNRAIILKHRLRQDELELFSDCRQTATKIIIPIDASDLKLGGRSVFIGQKGYLAAMASLFGDGWYAETDDLETLAILDELPSLDPFLLREHLKRHNRRPAHVYFEITQADIARMTRFVEADVQKLIDLAYAGAGDGASGSRLVRKILSMTVDEDTEPLRLTLRLAKADYQEGVFCWKGFLYYKWMLSESMPSLTAVVGAISSARPRGHVDAEARAYLEKSRSALRRSIATICDTARRSIGVYDTAFASLLEGHPQGFRDFLLNAPAMFTDLGERLGAVNHIISFWNFRFPQGRLPVVNGDELVDILSDFENSLSFSEARVGLALAG